MPRHARLDLPGLVYHLIARGIERRAIFVDDRDRERFLSRLGELAVWGRARIYAWCLLTNHFHLLVRRGEQLLAAIMQRLMTGHAVRFNLRHGRAGHLFQNRYKSIVVEEEPYFLRWIVRYIHLNPVRAGVVRTPDALDAFPFTGHGVLVGSHPAPWQDVDGVLERFAPGRADAVRRYREFVWAGWTDRHRHEFTGGGLLRSAGGAEALAGRRREDREAADDRVLGSGTFVEGLWRQEGETVKAVPARTWEEVLTACRENVGRGA